MRRCEVCGVSVRSAGGTCPLCHVPLPEGEPDAPDYPARASSALKRREQSLGRRIVRFVFICAALVCGLINLLTGGVAWSLIVVVSSAVFIIIERVTFRFRSIGARVLLPAIASIFYLIALDAVLGYRGWSLDYLAPLILLATMVIMSSLVLARQLHSRDFLMFLLALAGFTLIPLILLWTGVIRVGWPSLLAGFTAALLLATLFSFGDRTMRSELRRKFHL